MKLQPNHACIEFMSCNLSVLVHTAFYDCLKQNLI